MLIDRKEAIDLEIFAARIRMSILRQIQSAGKGHVGGSMSVADLAAVLYGRAMRVDPKAPRWPLRDRLVMSKGHCGCALYAALTLRGFFPQSWETTLNKLGTRLPSHCDRQKTPGIDMSTGSLGQGLSAAGGIAYANALLARDAFTFCVLGDGECQEGQVWEALMFAGHHRLGRLIAFVDKNGKQVDGVVEEILPVTGIEKHAALFGWHTQVVDGHDVAALAQAIDEAKETLDRPSLIVMNTVKGHGCFAQDMAFNHGIGVSEAQMCAGVVELQGQIDRLQSEKEACR